MRRLWWLAAAAALVAALLAPTARAAVPGNFCEDPHFIKGKGSSTQTVVQNSVFIPSYAAACPAAQGTVAYEGPGDLAAFNAARLRSDPFFAIDLPLTTAEKAIVENDTSSGLGRISPINHIPVLIDGFAVGYNLGSCGLRQPLRLRASVLALIYSGAITRWDDPLLVQGPHNNAPDNPGLAACKLAIKVAVRNDEAGPTNIFKDYLSKGSPAFATLKAKELTNVWPAALRVTCRGVGEKGMASCVSDPGAIGYVEYKVAVASNVSTMALLENSSGAFVGPASAGAGWPTNCPAAAASVMLPPDPVGSTNARGVPIPSGTTGDWSQVSLTYPPSGYALCSFTYVLSFQRLLTAYGNTLTLGQMRNVVDYLTVIVSDGVQAKLPAFGYAPLPPPVLALARAGVDRIDNS